MRFDDVPLYVVTNERKAFGAFGVIAMQDELREMFPDGYIVLPSSVHEVLVISKKEDLQKYSDIVRMINATEVNPEERLSNQAYELN